jgi:putative ABC transport system permease protein
MPDPKLLYRLLLKLYPAHFREEYASPLERQFQDEYRDAQSRGDRALLWLRALADLATSIPAQIAREMGQDVRYAARVYRSRAFVTASALVALALAIGATTGIFSVLNAVLLRSLPFRQPERLVEVQVIEYDDRAEFYDWRNHNGYLQDAATYRWNDWNLEIGRESLHAPATQTSANFFAVLGTEMVLGRSFSPDEDVPGRDDVAVIGYGLWRQMTGGDPRVLGTTIRLDGMPLTVIGVAPPGFDYPYKSVAWTPSVHDSTRHKSGWIILETLGRLKPGITLARAQVMHEADLRRESPGLFKGTPRQSLELVPLRDKLAGPVRQASLALMGMACFMLLVACANVAYLLLSRLTERRHELAIRTALGASRARLTQQLATEAILLTLSAAAAGLVVAFWVARLAGRFQPALSDAQSYTILDWRVIGFAAGLAVLTGLCFGVLPAHLIGRMRFGQDVLRGRSGAHGAAVTRARSVLLALQAALTLALLAGSVTMGRAFLKLLRTDLGFQTEHIVTMRFSLSGSAHNNASSAAEYYREALARLRAAPGVESAAAVDYLPMAYYEVWPTIAFRLDSGQAARGIRARVTPDYFRTMRTRIVEGRDFTDADRPGSDPVAILNEDCARGLGPIVGKKVVSLDQDKKTYTVVGVVRTASMFGPAHSSNFPSRQAFLPMDQSRQPSATFVVRMRGNPEAYIPMLRGIAQQLDRGVPMYDVKTLDQRLNENLAGPRFYATAVLFFGGFALLLAVIGVYGVAAHSIAQRRHEIGVRVAVGATPREVRLMLLRQSLAPVVLGAIGGVAAALGLGRFLNHLIESAQPLGLWTCAAAGVGMTAVVAAAVWSATRRVTRIDPMSALRAE